MTAMIACTGYLACTEGLLRGHQANDMTTMVSVGLAGNEWVGEKAKGKGKELWSERESP